MQKLTLVSMSGLRVGCDAVLAAGMQLPGLRKRADALAQLPPLGLLTIAGTVPEHWDIELISDAATQSVKEVADEILESKPDVVAFSCLTPSADRAAAIAAILRTQKIPTVVGGLHATAIPQWCEERFDVVAVGDGEPLLPELLSDFENNSLRRRYLADGRMDISRSPLPRWDLLQHSPPRFTLQTARGCPWACSFCAASRLLGTARAKDCKRIKQELQAITTIRTRPWLELADDNTFALERDDAELLECLQESGARWFTETDWRIAQRPELLRKLARSGCRQILIGVESTVFRYPGMGKKTAEFEQIIDAVTTIQDHGIAVNACFIVGADGETRASIERLAEFLQAADFSEIQLTLETPFPGTPIYRKLQQSNRLLYNDFSRYTLFDVVYRPSMLSPDELQDAFVGLIKQVFSPGQQRRRDTIRRQLRRIARQA